MAEFTDNLGAPGDYKRAVGSGSNAVDIFGPVADLVNMVGNANRKAANSESGALAEIKATRDLRANMAQDELAIITHAAQTGQGENLKNLLGEAGAPFLEDIKRFNELRKSGELSADSYDVYMENALMTVQHRYPDAASELGEWMSANKVDHTIARDWKAKNDADKATRNANTELENEAYKRGMENLTSLGLDGPKLQEFTQDRSKVVAHGLAVINDANRLKAEADLIARHKAELESNAVLSEAQRKEREASIKKASSSMVQTVISKADPILNVMTGELIDLAQVVTQSGVDSGMNKDFIDTVQIMSGKVDQWVVQQSAMLRAAGADPEDIKLVEERGKQVKTFFTEWSTGSSSAQAMQANQLQVLKTQYGLEGAEQMGVLQRLREGLGSDIVNGLLNGTLPGFSPNDTAAIRDKMVSYVRDTNNDIRKSTEAFLDVKRTLSNPNIPLATNPKELEGQIQVLSMGLQTSVASINSGVRSETAATHFTTATKQLSFVAGQALGPTTTQQSMEKLIGTLFTANWWNSWRKSGEMGVSPQDKRDMGNMSAMLAGEALDTLLLQSEGNVVYNKRLQAYEAVVDKSKGQSITVNGQQWYLDPNGNYVQQDNGNFTMARQMNALLTHVELMNNELQFVPKEALGEADSEGGKMTVRDVFASEGNLVQSLNNWVNAQGDSPNLVTSRQQFDKVIKNIRDNDPYAGLFKSVTVGSLNDRVNAANTRAAISGTPVSYGAIKNFDTYKTFIGQRENSGMRGNNAHDMSRSSASGTYGFLNEYTNIKRGKNTGPTTWDVNLMEIMPSAKDLTPEERWKLMEDPVIEDAVLEHFTAKNAEQLTASLGRPPAWEELNIAHLLGAEGASDFLKAFEANPMAATSTVLSKDVIENNPELTGNGKGTLLQLFNKRNGRPENTPSQGYFDDFNTDDDE